MDHYGSLPMPSLEERVNSLASNSEVNANATNKKISQSNLLKIIKKIAQTTPNYSMMGYAMGGKKLELEALLNELAKI